MNINLLGDGVHVAAYAFVLLALVGGTAATTFAFGRRWLDVVKNAAVVALACLLSVAGIGLELNRQNAWYPTLADVLGTSSTVGSVARLGSHSAESTFGRTTLTTADDRTLPALPSPGSRVQNYTVTTSIGGRRWAVQVILPADYFDANNAHRDYPVIFFGHGVPGEIGVYSSTMAVEGNLDPLVAQHKVGSFIAVIPELTPQGMDTECEVGPDGDTQTETWLAKDVPFFLKAHLRTIPQREAWAWAGYSAGGWCSAMMVMLHPEQFCAAIVLGGYFRPWWGSAKPDWAANSAKAKRLDLVALAHHQPPHVALFVQSATHDTESWPSTRQFLPKVRAPLFVTADIYPTGGHTFELWRPAMVAGVDWLGRNVPGFSPKA